MLEIKNLTKIYNTKGGQSTRALDNVSLSFGEKGMVFLLGKSGSGKSTLLNVSGGLDEPTYGEVIVKGKSSKDFTGSDFDSYRNTFVGFIFQEYNILDEFNVEDNVALALELQGKSKDRQKINDILREVELEAYAKRKPNTLSGGQKQRIAIARALVKDPQIIMADEPTGALDSATGRQVLETLKKLSQTRLVIVVSHDREFAEIYGDRIVELRDGKILSDVSKSQVPPTALNDGVMLIGQDTLTIRKGAGADGGVLRAVESFLAEAEGEVVITRGAGEISSFRKINRISESGACEKFDQTDPEKTKGRSYSPAEAKFIRSRLPVGKAIRIGASGLKLKPFRLILTIFLSVVAFIMFGLFSTMLTFNVDSVLARSVADSDYTHVRLGKLYRTVRSFANSDWSYEYDTRVAFTQEEVDAVAARYAGSFGYFTVDSSVANISLNDSASKYYYLPTFSSAAYLPEGHALRQKITVGEYPAALNEIAISSYTFEVLKNSVIEQITQTNGEYSATGRKITVTKAEDIVGEILRLSIGETSYFKVTGVFDSGTLPSKYDALKQTTDIDYALYANFTELIGEDVYSMVLISEELAQTVPSTGGAAEYEQFFYCDNILSLSLPAYKQTEDGIELGGSVSLDLNSYVKAYGEDVVNAVYFNRGGARTALADDEAVFSLRVLSDAYYYAYGDDGGLLKYFYANELAENPEADADWLYASAVEAQTEFYDKLLLCLNKYGSSSESERTAAKLDVIDTLAALGDIRMTLSVDKNLVEMTIVGWYFDEYQDYGLYFSQDFIDENLVLYEKVYQTYVETTNYVPEENAVYTGIFVPCGGESMLLGMAKNLLGDKNIRANDVYYSMSNSIAGDVELVAAIVSTLSKVFFWIGLILALFSALLLFNFISVSISNKRKEIGILRAVGARGTDVFKIFFAEAGIIVGVCALLAVVGTLIVCAVLNGILASELGFGVAMFVFGPLALLMMVGIALAVALIGTFLPVYLAARKKPVDSIRAL